MQVMRSKGKQGREMGYTKRSRHVKGSKGENVNKNKEMEVKGNRGMQREAD